jgi:hypothetical protein
MRHAVPIILAIAGLLIAVMPPRWLLSWDRRTGYWIYRRVLGSTGDESKAVRAAGVFYKVFGAFFIFISLSILLWSEK